MPRMRVEQLATSRAPAATLFQARLDWPRLPRLAAALERLAALAGPAARAVEVRAAATVGELYASTYYGACMPLLYGYPADLAFFARALEGGAPLDAVVDRYLAAPLVHELTHFGRERDLLSLYLDECVAGWLGVRVLRELAYPAPGDDNGLYAAPWFAQVGLALARAAGPERVVAAQSGALGWREALPGGLADALARLAWQDYCATRPIHFLSDSFRPDPWMKLFFLAAAGQPLDGWTLPSLAGLPWREVPAGQESPLDGEMVAEALGAMCLRNYQVERSFRVAARAPEGPIDVDLDACRVSSAPGPDGFDPVPLAHLFPPAVAARLRGRGIAGYTVELGALEGLDEVARAILDGAPTRTGTGYTLNRR
jgi:hypothetical protein